MARDATAKYCNITRLQIPCTCFAETTSQLLFTQSGQLIQGKLIKEGRMWAVQVAGSNWLRVRATRDTTLYHSLVWQKKKIGGEVQGVQGHEENSWGKRRDKERGGAVALVPKRRSKRTGRWDRRMGGGRRRGHLRWWRFCTVGWFHQKWSWATLLLLLRFCSGSGYWTEALLHNTPNTCLPHT